MGELTSTSCIEHGAMWPQLPPCLAKTLCIKQLVLHTCLCNVCGEAATPVPDNSLNRYFRLAWIMIITVHTSNSFQPAFIARKFVAIPSWHQLRQSIRPVFDS